MVEHAYSTTGTWQPPAHAASRAFGLLLGRQEGICHGFGRWKQDLHGARVDPRPEEASLLQDRSLFLLQRQSTSQGNMGDSEPPHQTFCVSLVLVSFTL